MKKAVAILQPTIEAEKSAGEFQKAGKILLATVKGDVHDIGKNIVSIVLSCNNYEIIDLGVMVPPEKIIEAIRTEKPDIVGLSGLITPSLEEMGIVAEEMEKAGFRIPLLIGGATTSKLHTALNIAPKYENGVVIYVKDASQSPSTVADLLSPITRNDYIEKIRNEYSTLRKDYSNRKTELVPLEEARKNAFRIDWSNFTPYVPKVTGRIVLPTIKIEEIVPYINWKFFFHSWKLSPKFASITNIGMCGHCRAQWLASFKNEDIQKAQEASRLYDDAMELLHKFIDLDAEYSKAVFGLYEAFSENDTVFIDKKAFPFLRQQRKNDKNEYLCLSDFVAPRSSGKKDYVGIFAVTAGAGADYLLQKYRNQGDEYSALLMKSVLDRLAEAATEWLHEKVRKEYWGYAPHEKLPIPELFAVKYQGIRPAVGYPSIPDQSINFLLHDMLCSDEIGITLTENGVMYPNASVSGFFFSHPQSRYFAVGPVSDEQLDDYAKRRGMSKDEIRKFLLSNIA